MQYLYTFNSTTWYCDLDTYSPTFVSVYTTFGNFSDAAANFWNGFKNPFTAVAMLNQFNVSSSVCASACLSADLLAPGGPCLHAVMLGMCACMPGLQLLHTSLNSNPRLNPSGGGEG